MLRCFQASDRSLNIYHCQGNAAVIMFYAVCHQECCKREELAHNFCLFYLLFCLTIQLLLRLW